MKVLAQTVLVVVLSATTIPFKAQAFPGSNDYIEKSLDVLTFRELQMDDFAELNTILSNVVVEIPDNPPPFSSGSITMDLYNIACNNLRLGDAVLSSRRIDSRSIELQISLSELDFTCTSRYNYKGALGVGGRGDVTVATRGNRAVATATVIAPDATSPPTDVVVKSCSPTIEIVDIDFMNGGIISWVLDTIEGLLRGTMERLAEQTICTELEQALQGQTKDFLAFAKTTLEQYTNDDAIFTDEELLARERQLDESVADDDNVRILNLQDQETDFGKWINRLLKQGVESFNTLVPHPTEGISGAELQINQLIRRFVLDAEGTLVLEQSDDGLVVFEGHDILTQTTIVVDRIKLVGLDTLTQFDPLKVIAGGKYTLQTVLGFEYLALEIEATITILPSTLPDSIIVDDGSTPQPVVERVNGFVGVRDLLAKTSLLTAIDQTALENLRIGALLKTEHLANCLMSIINRLELTSMTVEAADVLTPSISGLVSPGIDRFVFSAIDAAFLMYKSNMLKAAPAYFQQLMRPMLNERLINDFVFDRVNTGGWACPPTSSWLRTGRLDFRDLLLSPGDSRALGGSGQQQYGDLFSGVAMPYLRKQVSDVANLNANTIRSVTREQSGVEGTLKFVNVYEFEQSNDSTLYSAVIFKISKITVANLDTVTAPVSVIQPTSGNEVANQLSFGGGSTIRNAAGNGNLNVTVRAFLEVSGSKSPLQMKNEVDFTVAIPSTSLTVGFLANVRERSFLDFPLGDVTNPYCWLATLEGDLPSQTKSLALSALSFTLSTFFLDSVCVTSSSPGCHSISEVLKTLQQNGFAFTFRESVVALVEEIIQFLWDDLNVQEMVRLAPKHCPHSEQYEPERSVPELRLPAISGFSSNSLEALLAVGLVAIEASMVVVFKNQLLLSSSEAEPMNTATARMTRKPFPAGDDILDWQNLSERWGAWVDVAFDELREYISSPVEPKKELRGKRNPLLTPRANLLLRNYILDKTGALVIDLKWLVLANFGSSLSIVKVSVYGLDSITKVDPLVVTGAHTLKTTMALEGLEVVIDLAMSTPSGVTEQVQLSYNARDIALDVEVSVALNTTIVGKTRLGSVFDLSSADSCLVKGVQALDVLHFNFSTQELDPPTISRGYFSSTKQEAVSIMLQSLHMRYNSDIVEAIPLLFDSTIRETVNALLPGILESLSSECPEPPIFEENGLIDFRELLLSKSGSEKLGGPGVSTYGNLFSLIYDMLEKEVMQTGASNRPLLSDLVGKLTEKQSNRVGTIQVAGKAVDSKASVQVAGLEALLGIQVSNVLIQNLDSIGDPLHLLWPVEAQPTVLNNTLSFGVDSKPLSFEGTVVLSLTDGAEMNIWNEVNVSLTVADVSLQIAFLAQILENSFSSFPFEDFSDWRCWLSTILLPSINGPFDGMRVVGQNYSMGNFSMSIACTSCTGPDFDDLLMSLYAPSDVSAAIQEQAGSLMEAGFLQGALESLIFDSKKRCPHHPSFDPEYVAMTGEDSALIAQPMLMFSSAEDSKKPMYFNIANGIIAACLCIIGIVGKIRVARRNKEWMASLSHSGQYFLYQQREKQIEMDKWLDMNTSSLISSRHIPKTVRWGVPIALVANVCLFLGGHLGVLSVVSLDAMFVGESFTINNFMEFSFLDSTRKTYNNGGAEMVVLIWIFTGIWPYVKLLLSLLAWVVPTDYIGVKRRGNILLWIDALAKLSVVDIFTMLLGVAIILVFIGGPDESISSDGVYYALKAIVIPKAGCYCLLMAQRLSRVSSRFLLEQHENVVTRATQERVGMEGSLSISQIHLGKCLEDSIETESCLIQGNLSSQSSGQSLNDKVPCDETSLTESRVKRPSLARTNSGTSSTSLSTLANYQWGYWGVVFGFVAIVLIFAIGCIFAPAIAFDLSSIAGLAVESGKTFEEAVSEYGVFIVVSGILVEAKFVLASKVDYIGLGLLLAAVGISISLMFIIQTYHFVKHKLLERRKRHENPDGPCYGHEGCGLPLYFRLFKWNHMEIFLISFAIGVWQLGSIASYAMYLYCDIMTRVYDVLTFLGIAEASTSQCFNDQASNGGNLIIILGSFLILLVSFFFEARSQHKKNIENCMKYVDDDDVPQLSLAWSEDPDQNKRYSHLHNSLSLTINNTESFLGLSSTPLSPGLTRSMSTDESHQSPHSSMSEMASICDKLSETSCASNDNIEPRNSFPPQEVTTCPVATPCSVSSQGSARSSTIDAACEIPPAAIGQPWSETLTADKGSVVFPPLVPSCSMEEDPHEESSCSYSPPFQSPPRLSFLLNRFPIGPRRSLPPPTATPRSGNNGNIQSPFAPRPSHPRRVQSTGDFIQYMDENPSRFTNS